MAERANALRANKSLLHRADVLQIARILREPLASTRKRLAAMERYNATALPDRVQHLWRYTDPADLLLDGPAVPKRSLAVGQDPGLGVALIPGAGPFIDIDEALVKAGVEATPLAASEQGLALLGRLVPPEHGLFEALSAAIWSVGAFVRVPAGVVLAQPIRVVHLASARTTATRLVVRIEAGASASVVEEHLGGESGCSVYSATELFVERDANLDHALIQRWDPGTRGHVTTRTLVLGGARYRAAAVSLGGDRYKADLGAELAEPGARSDVQGAVFGDQRQQLDHHTVHRHTSAHTVSDLGFKAALAGRARSAYTGLIRIEAEATGSEAYQECRNLLLSERCQAESIPELEILTNEVQCKHGAATAPIGSDELFYLMSRGVSRPEAVRLIVLGFFEQGLTRLPASIRDQVAAAVENRLLAMQRGGG